MKDDRTYIPLRAVGESMGAEVLWDAETECAYVNFTEDDAIAKLVKDISPVLLPLSETTQEIPALFRTITSILRTVPVLYIKATAIF